ncbi:DUF350 domain-containing protein [Paenibacillus sp. AK121]|uniref:DUF350 domain-containing protein n=1 Tax=Paenibacillus TaxID=44249 RepID=UPI000589F5A7|nr:MULTISPECIES: DUF350 domain-containing protein [Paenibacillus]AJE53795.1 cell surface protein [Paenibacillus polymyxa]MBU9709946.1 DUF350 domain-containing protein [Paenibacillus sp. AK121]OAZ40415.1 DUF350 domain-containing protein [Paenibacillus polymyxa]
MHFLETMKAMLVWTGAGAILLFVLMYVDSLFTKYKDFAEVKSGNMAVTVRMIMKLIAQGYILSGSIATANNLLEALVYSVIAFIILLVLEVIVRLLLRYWAQFDLDKGTQEGKIGFGLFSGALHLVGALIITACF